VLKSSGEELGNPDEPSAAWVRGRQVKLNGHIRIHRESGVIDINPQEAEISGPDTSPDTLMWVTESAGSEASLGKMKKPLESTPKTQVKMRIAVTSRDPAR